MIGTKPSYSDWDDDELFVVGDGTDEALLVIIGKSFGVSRDLPESDSMERSVELLDCVP